MAWRNWSVIIVLILANYLVFSALAVVVFPPSAPMAPTHIPWPTFTPAVEMRNVGTLTYDFLTPSATPTATSPSATPTLTPRPTRTPRR